MSVGMAILIGLISGVVSGIVVSLGVVIWWLLCEEEKRYRIGD
jgi:preprotein translocase subunit SecF